MWHQKSDRGMIERGMKKPGQEKNSPVNHSLSESGN
jgi:hypothetical protein